MVECQTCGGGRGAAARTTTCSRFSAKVEAAYAASAQNNVQICLHCCKLQMRCVGSSVCLHCCFVNLVLAASSSISTALPFLLQVTKQFCNFRLKGGGSGVGDNVLSKETRVTRLLCPYVCRASRARCPSTVTGSTCLLRLYSRSLALVGLSPQG